jgi:hypothetical protein
MDDPVVARNNLVLGRSGEAIILGAVCRDGEARR